MSQFPHPKGSVPKVCQSHPSRSNDIWHLDVPCLYTNVDSKFSVDLQANTIVNTIKEEGSESLLESVSKSQSPGGKGIRQAKLKKPQTFQNYQLN